MVFSSSVFLLLFLPLVFVLNYLIKNEYSNALLMAASILFYAWGEPYLVLLMVLSILVNYALGLAISKAKGSFRRLPLIAAVIFNIGALGYYKYAGFALSSVNAIFKKDLVTVPEIALPIGISFFTFQALSYVIDVYRDDTKASKNVINVALYISFFPQLIAGPIVKYKDINRQIENRTISFDGFTIGFKRFIYGLAKKVLIANVLGLCADTVYGCEMEKIGFGAAWLGALAYTFQIYYDFSGYSDMAIGLGKMFGFDFLENFQYPYLSGSISEFWRRWHISLGTWFKEYVYIPLGGNRKGKVRTYVNLVIVFFLTGLWHGADWSFIIWGLYHGLFSVLERLGFKKILEKIKVLPTIYTFLVVHFGWVLFRAKDTATGFQFIEKMLTPWKHVENPIPYWEYMDKKTVAIFICAVIGMGFLKKFIPEKIQKIWKDSVPEAVYCVILLILCLASMAADTYNPFIYFQF